MQNELRAAPVAKRYFGRDITNIEAMSEHRDGSLDEKNRSYGPIEAQKRERSRQQLYRPFSGKPPILTSNHSNIGTSEFHRAQEDYKPRKERPQQRDMSNKIVYQAPEYYVNPRDETYHERMEDELGASLEFQVKGHHYQKMNNAREESHYPHSRVPEPAQQYPARALSPEHGNRQAHQKVFPETLLGGAFRLPLNHIWSYLILKRVILSNLEQQRVRVDVPQQPKRHHGRNALHRHRLASRRP